MKNSKIVLNRFQTVDYDNTGEEIVAINISKIENIYHDFIEAPKLSSIFNLLGYAVTFLIAALTCDQSNSQKVLGVDLNIKTVFWVAMLIFAALSIIKSICWFSNGRKKDKKAFIDAMKAYGENSP